MGHKISKEQIDPGVKDHIMSFVGDVADLETEVNTDIISAVNSLMVDRVDNAENMGKLANAIGEPVTANHSVDEVVEGLGEMLSTFKTNMMNSGVMVESSDKFKQLIDKIKGLTEGEGNKGIQFAEGECDVSVYDNASNVSSNYYDPTNGVISYGTTLDFTPTAIFLCVPKLFWGFNDTQMVCNAVISSLYNNSSSKVATLGAYNRSTNGASAEGIVEAYITNVTNSSFKLYVLPHSGMYRGINCKCQWYAIGVGEEDTTLRDSLASILGDKGVDVTEDDDMASLITKVDSISGGLDIISAAELPATGKPNQMCIINENSGSFLVTSNNNDKNPDGFKVLLGSADNYPLIPITINNVIENYRIRKVFYGSTQLDSYYWDNNEWTRVSAAKLMVYDNGSFPNEDIIGVLPSNKYVKQTSERLECRTDPLGDWSDGYISFTKPVDFNVYNTITFQAKSSADSHHLDFGLSTEPVNIYSTGRPSEYVKKVESASVDTSNSKYTVDISSFSGIGYLTIIIPSVQRFSYYYIYSIELS